MKVSIEPLELERLVAAGYRVDFGKWAESGDGLTVSCPIKIITPEGKEVQFKSAEYHWVIEGLSAENPELVK